MWETGISTRSSYSVCTCLLPLTITRWSWPCTYSLTTNNCVCSCWFPVQATMLGEVDGALRAEYTVRRRMLLERIKVTLQVGQGRCALPQGQDGDGGMLQLLLTGPR